MHIIGQGDERRSQAVLLRLKVITQLPCRFFIRLLEIRLGELDSGHHVFVIHPDTSHSRVENRCIGRLFQKHGNDDLVQDLEFRKSPLVRLVEFKTATSVADIGDDAFMQLPLNLAMSV